MFYSLDTWYAGLRGALFNPNLQRATSIDIARCKFGSFRFLLRHNQQIAFARNRHPIFSQRIHGNARPNGSG